MCEVCPTERLRKAWRARQVTWLASGLIVCVLVWAVFAQLDQVVVAQGQMIPTRTVQKIQSLEGGILKSMLVEEGQMVEAGQPLLELDDTRFRACVEEAGQSIRGLEAAQARLQAELASVAIDNGDVLVSPVPMAEPATPSPGWESERAALAGRLASLQGRLFQADRRVEQQRQIQQEAQRNLRTQQQSLALQRQTLLLGTQVALGFLLNLALLLYPTISLKQAALQGRQAARQRSPLRFPARRWRRRFCHGNRAHQYITVINSHAGQLGLQACLGSLQPPNALPRLFNTGPKAGVVQFQQGLARFHHLPLFHQHAFQNAALQRLNFLNRACRDHLPLGHHHLVQLREHRPHQDTHDQTTGQPGNLPGSPGFAQTFGGAHFAHSLPSPSLFAGSPVLSPQLSFPLRKVTRDALAAEALPARAAPSACILP